MKYFLLSAAALLCFVGSSVAQQPLVERIQSATSLVDRWQPERHVYLKGNIGVADARLQELDVWIREKHPNWTVILLQSSRGESFQKWRGMDAVDNAVGRQIANKTAFGDLKDERTGEPNGAFFILYLEERKFTYYGSAAMDRRALGERQWIGNLDRPAIAAMRGGGRIVDAVKDTISNIENKLTRKIEEEIQTRLRAEMRAEQNYEDAHELAKSTALEVEGTINLAAEVIKKRPQATGPLVSPPLANWRSRLGAGDKMLQSGRQYALPAMAEFKSVSNEVETFTETIQTYLKDEPQLAELESRIATQETPLEVASVIGHIGEAKSALKSARENYARADTLYSEQLAAGHRALDRAEAEIKAWRAAEQAEKRRAIHRQKMIQFSSIAALVAFLISLIVMNRLRRPAKESAEKALRHWKRQLSGKFDTLFALMDRANRVVGPSHQLEDRGYVGTTLELCQKAIREVDELFIMSAATDRVMDRVTNLVERGGLVNTFFAHRYRTGEELLGSKPIGFDRDEGLSAILAPKDFGLLGLEGDYKPFRMSFGRLIEAYDKKQAVAIETLDRLEEGIDGLPLALERQNVEFVETTGVIEQLAVASQKDGFFPATAYKETLLPAIEQHIDSATDIGRTDPVVGFEKFALLADRQLRDTKVYADAVGETRDRAFPEIRELATLLVNLGRRVKWISEEYRELSEESERLARLSTDRSIEIELGSWKDSLTKKIGQVRNTVSLAKRADGEVQKSIEKAATEIDSSRSELAKQLGCKLELLFREDQIDPFELLESARNERLAAESALDHGGIGIASESFREIEKILGEIRAILNLNRQIADGFVKRANTLDEKLAETKASVVSTSLMLDEMLEGYAPAVLLFSSQTGIPSRGQDSIRNAILDANEYIEKAAEAIPSARQYFSSGHLVKADSLLEVATNEIGHARHQLALIETQHAALKSVAAANPDELQETLTQLESLRKRAHDTRTMQPTIDLWNSTKTTLKSLQASLNAPYPDPFATALGIKTARRNLVGLDEQIASDWDLHQAATETAKEMKHHLEQGSSLVYQASSDGIPDSSAIEKASNRLAALSRVVDSIVDEHLPSPHGDWNLLHQKSSETNAELLTVRGILKRELVAAKSAALDLTNAAGAIRSLRGWHGSFSVSVERSAGSRDYQLAEAALANGDYNRASQLANAARQRALQAEHAADAENSRLRRQEEARQRRRAMSASSSSRFGGGSSFGGSSSFGSSGSSRSSFSSGSGTSRSGW